MIVARLKEGLGNQMFQYAAGLALSLRNGTDFYFDTSVYETDNWIARNKIKREFGLDIFRLTARQLRGWRRFWVLNLIRRRFSLLRKALHALGVPVALEIIDDTGREREVHPQLQKPGKRFFLDGYWQTEGYFNSCRDVILREFTFRQPPDAANAAMVARIRSCAAVCVHVRRTDYTTTESLAVRGVCSLDYYRTALDWFRDNMPDAQFFVFSDDPQWTASHFPKLPSINLVTHNVGRHDAEDLRLMMSCRHFIIANSSFSWWAAWLGNDPGKIVIAPEKWMANGDDYDIVPDSWMRLGTSVPAPAA